MPSWKQRFESVRRMLTEERHGPAIDAGIDWLTYIIGILPAVPISQVASIANRIITDKRLRSKLEAIATSQVAADTRIDQLEEGLARVEGIARAAARNTDIQREILQLVDELKAAISADQSHFRLDTSDWSEQQIIDCVIDADRVLISADKDSLNLVEGTKLKSRQADLRATRRSRNIIRNTQFSGPAGSVELSGTHTQEGSVTLQDASIAYQGGQSGTTMSDWYMGTDADGNFVIGVRPQQTVEGRCPACNRQAVFSAADLAGKTHIECPFCRHVAPLSPLR
nr:MAG: hypothetical protein DIU57_16875 [Pseudomonadota bacterium]